VLVVAHHQTCFAQAVEDFTAVGWRTRPGYVLDEEPWDGTDAGILCTGQVVEELDVPAVVEAAVRGAGIVALAEPSCPAYLRLVGDLSKIGHVRVLHGQAGGEELPQDERQLLLLLAEGLTVREAALRCAMSVRSAERRLSSARQRLGVRTTAQAVTTVLRPGAPGPDAP
jgi:DNA-binding CsgD family transcriptional regulator